jgi:hypothetical protein
MMKIATEAVLAGVKRFRGRLAKLIELDGIPIKKKL